MKYLLVGLTIFAAYFLTGVSLIILSSHVPRHYGEASWTLQGETSHLDCPGQHPWYVESDGHSFFMGCRQ